MAKEKERAAPKAPSRSVKGTCVPCMDKKGRKVTDEQRNGAGVVPGWCDECGNQHGVIRSR